MRTLQLAKRLFIQPDPLTTRQALTGDAGKTTSLRYRRRRTADQINALSGEDRCCGFTGTTMLTTPQYGSACDATEFVPLALFGAFRRWTLVVTRFLGTR